MRGDKNRYYSTALHECVCAIASERSWYNKPFHRDEDVFLTMWYLQWLWNERNRYIYIADFCVQHCATTGIYERTDSRWQLSPDFFSLDQLEAREFRKKCARPYFLSLRDVRKYTNIVSIGGLYLKHIFTIWRLNFVKTSCMCVNRRSEFYTRFIF